MTDFPTEAALCAAFADAVPKGWTVYNETGGFDMVLVHDTGFQIGVEAKMRLNPKVILQAVDTGIMKGRKPGPDARAVLVPHSTTTSSDLARLASLLSVTVISLRRRTHWEPQKPGSWAITPDLPEAQNIILGRFWTNDQWFDLCPVARVKLPEYVPDVPAGTPSPMVLGRWKIQAIKVCIWVERHKAVTRQHFRALGIDPGRWMTGYWLKKGMVRGEWVAGPHFPLPQFRAQHPTIVDAIEADFDKWSVENGLSDLPAVTGQVLPDQGQLL